MPTTVRQQPLIAMLSPVFDPTAMRDSRMTSRTPGSSGITSTTSARLWTSPVNIACLEKRFFAGSAMPDVIPHVFRRRPANEDHAQDRYRIVPDDQDEHQREHDCDELSECALSADELRKRMRVWQSRHHEHRDDHGE